MTRIATKLHVQDVMTRDVVTVDINTSLHAALEIMEDNRVTALPVVDAHGVCVGVVSSSDLVDLTRQLDEDLSDIDQLSDVSRTWLLERLRDHGLGQTMLSDLMSDSVATITPEATLAAAAKQMIRNRVHRLPVVDAKNRVVGIVSTMDLLEAFVDGARD